jgi:hypothetical protein
MHLFDVGAKALQQGQNITLQQFSDETKCESLLISEYKSLAQTSLTLPERVMRVLVNMEMFGESDINVFKPSPLTAILSTESPFAQAIIHL